MDPFIGQVRMMGKPAATRPNRDANQQSGMDSGEAPLDDYLIITMEN